MWGTQDAFNEYTYMMTHNKVIKIVSFVLYASIVLHAVMAIAVVLKNRQSRPVNYASKKANSSWASQNMIYLGLVLLVYIVMHLAQFWYVMKFGQVEHYETPNGVHVKDMWTIVIEAFKIPWIVAAYVISMLALGLHLVHGFQSGFQTVGVNHPKYTPIIKNLSIWIFGILIPLAFAIVPIVVHFQHT
ncbi:MAG: succinate dehydrogenase / fumarate reductase cytochrome b subunit [Limisphaerales bacterium]|jgi:succinate dehydrogenase / fumarate reductase cytochrome b subunit